MSFERSVYLSAKVCANTFVYYVSPLLAMSLKKVRKEFRHFFWGGGGEHFVSYCFKK